MPATKKAKLTPEERAERSRLRREAEHDAWKAQRKAWQAAQPPSLTHEEYMAGVPCPGCGLPMLGKYADGETQWAAVSWERHAECHAGRWGIEGCPVHHCDKCCPPKPWSQQQIEEFARLLRPPVVAPPPAPIKKRRPTSAQRIAALEAEVARLRSQQSPA